MKLEIPKNHPFKFDYTYKININTYILFEILNYFSSYYKYDPIIKAKLNELIFYLDNVLFPIREENNCDLSYDLISEEFFIKDTFQRFIPKNKK